MRSQIHYATHSTPLGALGVMTISNLTAGDGESKAAP